MTERYSLIHNGMEVIGIDTPEILDFVELKAILNTIFDIRLKRYRIRL